MSAPSDPMATFLRGLRGFVRSLPSEEERAEILRTLRNTRDFLNEVESLVLSIPTLETSEEMSGAISRLDLLASQARDNGLHKVLGIPKPRSTMKAANYGEVRARAEELLKEIRPLGRLGRAEITKTLERSGAPVMVLRAVAGGLNLPLPSSAPKADLIRRIATHIVNDRGYRLLRGDFDEDEDTEQPREKVS